MSATDIFASLRREIVSSFMETRDEVLGILAQKEQILLKKLEELEQTNAEIVQKPKLLKDSLTISSPDILSLSKTPKKKLMKKETENGKTEYHK